MHRACKQVFIYPRSSTHTLQNTPEMVLGVKTQGGATAENIRNIEEFGDKQRDEVCLSVFIAWREWTGLAWQISTLAPYQGHFGESGIKQRSLWHREHKIVTCDCICLLQNQRVANCDAQTGLRTWDWFREQSTEGEHMVCEILRYTVGQSLCKRQSLRKESALFFPGKLFVVSIAVHLGIWLYLWFSCEKLFQNRVSSLSFFYWHWLKIICLMDESKWDRSWSSKYMKMERILKHNKTKTMLLYGLLHTGTVVHSVKWLCWGN